MRKAMLLLAVFGLVGWLWAADSLIGTWKMNPTKTKVTGPGAAFKSGSVIIEGQGNGLAMKYDTVGATGQVTHGEYTAKYDGKDYTIKGDPENDAVSLHRLDSNTVDFVYKKGGKTVMNEQCVVSKDGKIATVTFKGKDPKGVDFTIVTVWEKQ
jgi:hypothetical protein